jgi:homoserine dehydrogenase
MENGKHVVTANKALLAHHWEEIVAKAEQKRVSLGFEGSVAGGIPLIHAIRRGLVANRIRRVTGIINGTCNYILTRMARERKPFAEILADAQANGFAEANPALDVDGIDAAQKLTILVNLCFDLTVGPTPSRTGIPVTRSTSPAGARLPDEAPLLRLGARTARSRPGSTRRSCRSRTRSPP